MTRPNSLGGGFLGAIDIGTTGVRCVLYNEGARAVARAYRRLHTTTPQPGWVEQDPNELLEATTDVVGEVLHRSPFEASRLLAVGLTNQRETVIAWDPDTGKALYPAIGWQDRRTARRCRTLERCDAAALIRARTGLPIDPFFSASKIEWLLATIPGLARRAASGGALFGTVDSWILWNLTGEHVTDDTNASRTQLYDIDRREWSEELLDLFGVPATSLPRVVPSLSVVGCIRPDLVAGARVLVAGVLGDQQAALLGQARTCSGETHVTWGTGAFLLMNCGPRRPTGSERLLTTIALTAPCGEAWYALEGSVFVAGAAIQWLRDGMGLLADEAESEQLASVVDSTGGVFFVPALTGLGSPYWDPHARGAIVGLTRGTRCEHVVRAALEAIAYQTHDVVRAMERDAGMSLSELRVGGGTARNDLLCQFQSDILGIPVVRAQDPETTALGAAFAAGLSAGVWDRVEDVRDLSRSDRPFTPRMPTATCQQRLADWTRAVDRSREWIQEREE